MATKANVASFSIHCNAKSSGTLNVPAERLSVTIAQKIVRDGIEELWDSVVILSETTDGLLITRILLCHPNWNEPQEIARLQSDMTAMQIQVHPDNSGR